MFLILNRLRGTQGLWSKIIGLLLALATLTLEQQAELTTKRAEARAYLKGQGL